MVLKNTQGDVVTRENAEVSTLGLHLFLIATDHDDAGGLLAEVHVVCDPVHHHHLVRLLNTRQPDLILEPLNKR